MGVRGFRKIMVTTTQKIIIAIKARIVSIFRTVFFINNSFIPDTSG